LSEEEYKEERLAAVVCAVEGEGNCRHDWNRLHPDDPVTEEEQRDFWANLVLDHPRHRDA
jgi:hypothetical protein